MKKLLFSCFSFIIALASIAQVKSPEQFLGYPIGSRYTPHYKIVLYFQYISETVPTLVKLKQYGETNEHRPLYLAFISSADNIANLESIRLNNMRLANLAKDKMAASETSPAIVWLSYNVHGNETSSSEAAMLTLFSLVDPANIQTKSWIKNTVVIIDPCLNPDGRDRYVNWFSSVSGVNNDPSLIAREHREPWPGGRSNHYNFDLNRDWAWQTQIETQQRIVEYNRWMPQVHVDFHEQGPSQPYYFAPAAQPYHEIITKWQRDFQVSIGKNHAKYFDQNGWLYFTKEIFDLLYPSYGDTYPLYNGSVGMTYEQGGGPAGGLAVLTDEGDTLTLYDRALHHYTTGLSTIEVASTNADNLVRQFHKFFNDASSGLVGDFKTYIIKNGPDDNARVKDLVKLLDKNGIVYGSGSGAGKGYNYFTQKEESFTIAPADILISSSQPKAAMLKVLFEPVTKLVDSATYDITAWAMPYIYGVTAYASKQAISVNGTSPLVSFQPNRLQDAYGYILKWQSVSSATVLAQLLQKGVRVRYSEMPFSSQGQSFTRGSILVLKSGNQKLGSALWSTVENIANANQVELYPVKSGMVDTGFDFGSSYVRAIKAPRVAMLTGESVNSNAAGEIWNLFEQQLKYKLTLINASDVNRINWSDIDVLIMPDGRYKFLTDKETAAGFQRWIEGGGKVVAIESAVTQLSKQEWSTIHAKNDSDSNSDSKKDPYVLLQNFESRERDQLSNSTPGAIFKVDVDNTHPLMFGYPRFYYTLKMDNNVYDFIKEGGWNVGVIKKQNQVAGYVGYRLNPKLKDGLLFGVQDLGNGTISYLADNVMFRSFWNNGKLMFCNAVFLVGQ